MYMKTIVIFNWFDTCSWKWHIHLLICQYQYWTKWDWFRFLICCQNLCGTLLQLINYRGRLKSYINSKQIIKYWPYQWLLVVHFLHFLMRFFSIFICQIKHFIIGNLLNLNNESYFRIGFPLIPITELNIDKA